MEHAEIWDQILSNKPFETSGRLAIHAILLIS